MTFIFFLAPFTTGDVSINDRYRLILSLFVGVYRHTRSYTDVTISGKGLNMLTYARHSWSLLLWHGAYVYNGHLRGPVTLALIADSNTQSSACGANALTHYTKAVVFILCHAEND